jgi:multicomponent Na+:H+ antiporter subunit A
MAGIPPLLGFPAKEAAIEAVIQLSGGERLVVGGLIIGGSVLTVAYTTRFLVGVFGDRTGPAGPADLVVTPARPAMATPEAILGAASVLGFVALGWVTDVVRDAAVTIDPGAEVYSLYRWPGLTSAFVTSVFVVAGGLILGLLVARRTVATGPAARGAAAVDALVDGVATTARLVAARVQHGSLPLYLATTVVVLAVAAGPFLLEIDTDALYWYDNRAEGILVLMVVAVAVAAARVTSRLGAALVLGGVGFSVAGLFVAHGAPDLVLTQLLVETVVVVGFVVGLGRLSIWFPPAGRLWTGGRLLVSLLMGVTVAVALAAGASNPVGEPPARELAETAVSEGGGNNVVNVILTDTRALDTLGEVIVLLAVAVGILTLTAKGSRFVLGPRKVPSDELDDGSGGTAEAATVAHAAADEGVRS